MPEFDQFWKLYPRKQGKLDAIKAYAQARKNGARPDELLAGVQRYLEHLPDEPRFIKLPGSWIRAGCWMDEYDAPAKPQRGMAEQHRVSAYDWFQECREVHGGACELNRHRHIERMELEAWKARTA